MRMEELIERLARAEIGATFNFYRDGDRAATRRERLLGYLNARRDAPLLLVGEAPGYRGARVSGIPFTSERQISRAGPAEATATIVHRVLAELDIEEDVLLWNVVPTHPGTEQSNRRPTRVEIEAGLPYLQELTRGRVAIPVGRLAHAVLGGSYVRHPSHGGAIAFAEGLRHCLSATSKAGTGSVPARSLAAASPAQRSTDRCFNGVDPPTPNGRAR
jgi:uracil-DNA glycosylase family 4